MEGNVNGCFFIILKRNIYSIGCWPTSSTQQKSWTHNNTMIQHRTLTKPQRDNGHAVKYIAVHRLLNRQIFLSCDVEYLTLTFFGDGEWREDGGVKGHLSNQMNAEVEQPLINSKWCGYIYKSRITEISP